MMILSFHKDLISQKSVKFALERIGVRKKCSDIIYVIDDSKFIEISKKKIYNIANNNDYNLEDGFIVNIF